MDIYDENFTIKEHLMFLLWHSIFLITLLFSLANIVLNFLLVLSGWKILFYAKQTRLFLVCHVNVLHTYWAPLDPVTEALHAVELTLFLWHLPAEVVGKLRNGEPVECELFCELEMVGKMRTIGEICVCDIFGIYRNIRSVNVKV